ncbi:beta 1-4 rhamnosyltransferase Cps2T [Terribacillus saccharophilus]|uniref:beta 1-4 rhamnosyltransferase Cps2T n=1 Tax=Terribacillus saccharophilus TaxID=361277 RepID=UPI002989D54B|nr:DUF1972 domain-containing protein [Terribacillus saccharophilus]MCM3225244.1 DUF1972 domain-containing protein [Terribacillus saccharophilus]
MKHVFIIGSKGIPANYGGFETFVDHLTKRKENKNIKYYVSCLTEDQEKITEHNGALCFHLSVKDIGSAKAITYDLKSLKYSIKYIKENGIHNAVIYILACRIGPFINIFMRDIKKLGITLLVNPDGNEWKRTKWSKPVQAYWKLSEKLMVKHSDLLVCDSKGIESYIHDAYEKYKPRTTYISYGAEVFNDKEYSDVELKSWYSNFNLSEKEYYLVVGRFVPENNYELIIRDYMKSNTKKDLVIVTNYEGNDFYTTLLNRTNFDRDKRIKFVGTVYDQLLLSQIRQNAFGYIHGHEVGGTNPSLLEALATTDINIVFDVCFNTEVTGDSAFVFGKKNKRLPQVIEKVELLNKDEINGFSEKAKERIKNKYSWDSIVKEYETLFESDTNVGSSQ